MTSRIKSFSVDNGDMFYIRHGSDNFTIIDCNLLEGQSEDIIQELVRESSGKAITRFISTHPDDDHIHGLELLDDRMSLLNFYCVKNRATKPDKSDSFDRYCKLRDSDKAFYLEKGCHRCWMNRDDELKKYGSSGINVLWPALGNEDFKAALEEAADGESPNNISPIITYDLEGGVKAVWMGDLETSFMSKIEKEVSLEPVDILFAPHHGRLSGRPPKSWMDAMDPGLVVIGEADSDVLDYYGGYTHICQNTAGEMLFVCEAGHVHIYAEKSYRIEDLDDLGKGELDGLEYVGSLRTKRR